ncbi:nucleotide sugar dehydrogenase [Paenibacillus sp. YSY-4.3]
MKICVIGLGYIGLPTAIMFAKHGISVHGVDINSTVIENLSSGQIHIEEPGLKEMLADVLETSELEFGTHPVEADVYIIAVPTPVNEDKSPNLDYVIEATQSIVPYIKKGNLVILESTVPPRTTEDVLLPILRKSNLNVESELFVAHSPERVLPGKLLHELVNNDRIAGGINSESANKTAELYRVFVKGNIHLTDATTAEMTKCMENTYRDVNIALANELAKVCYDLDINVYDVIEMANKHPRVNIHSPGPGVGGHCLAIDPYFIYNQSPHNAKLIKLARETNDSMPKFVADIIEMLLISVKQPKIAVFGTSYKGNINDQRESPALKVIEILENKYSNLSIYDPYVTSEEIVSMEEAVKDADLIVVLTDHSEFKEMDHHYLARQMRTPLIFDTKNIIPVNKDSELQVVNFGNSFLNKYSQCISY